MAIQTRRGSYADFDPTKMLPGEWAVSIDEDTSKQVVWMCFAPGVVKQISTGGEHLDEAAIEKAVNDYLKENPVQSGATQEQVEQINKNTTDIGNLSEEIEDIKENGTGGGTGADGKDGISPIATVKQTDTGAIISIQDANGTTTANILHGKDGANGKDGADGYTPQKGVDYFDGEKGEQGIQGIQGEKGDKGDAGATGKDGANGISATHSWNGTTLTVTSASGTSSADLKGDKGDTGAKGDKGDKGDTGANGSDANVTADNIVSALGYAPANNEDVEQMQKEIAAQQSLEKNPLWGKKVSFVGDSICAGSDSDTSYLGGYGKIIAARNNMTYQNLGQGGSTITAETYSSSTGVAKGWICRMVANMDADSDYAIVEGGLNDAWQYFDHGTITIGEISTGYNATLDDTTYYGAFESMLKQLVTKFQGKKIGYIAVPKMMNLYDSERNVPNFYHIALECCAKWGVPVCDLNTIIPPFEYLKTLGTEYTADGTHPTYEGCIKYYCDPIEAWMKTLTVGGNNSANIARQMIEEYTKGMNDAITALQNGKLDNTGISFRKALLPLADGTTLEIDVLTAVDGTVVIKYTNRVLTSIDTDKTIFGGDYNGDGKNDGYLTGKRLSSSGAVKDVDAYTKSAVTGYIPVKGGDVIRIFGVKWGTTKHAMNYMCAYDSNFSFIGGHSTTSGASSLTLATNTKKVATVTAVDENLNTTLTIENNSSIAYIRVSSCGETQAEGIDFANAIITVNEEIK